MTLIFYLVFGRATHQTLSGSISQRGGLFLSRPPARLPAAYRKRGSNLFLSLGGRESEARNEEPMREVAPFGTPDNSELSGVRSVMILANGGGGPVPAALICTLRCRHRATRLRLKASIMPAHSLIPLDIIGRLCLLPANEERRA